MAPYCLPIQVCISSLASDTLPEETQPHTSKCHTTALPRLSRLVFASGPSQGCFLCLDCPSAFLPPGKLLLLFKNLQWLAFPWCILLHGLGQHPYLPLGPILFRSDYITLNHKISLHFYVHRLWIMSFFEGKFSSVAQSCPTLCNPMNCSTPGLPVHHQLPEFTQTHVHQVSDATQPSHPLSSPSSPAPNPSQHEGLFQWVNVSRLCLISAYFPHLLYIQADWSSAYSGHCLSSHTSECLTWQKWQTPWYP